MLGVRVALISISASAFEHRNLLRLSSRSNLTPTSSRDAVVAVYPPHSNMVLPCSLRPLSHRLSKMSPSRFGFSAKRTQRNNISTTVVNYADKNIIYIHTLLPITENLCLLASTSNRTFVRVWKSPGVKPKIPTPMSPSEQYLSVLKLEKFNNRSIVNV